MFLTSSTLFKDAIVYAVNDRTTVLPGREFIVPGQSGTLQDAS